MILYVYKKEIISLETYLEEAKRKEKVLINKMVKREKNYHILKENIVSLRVDLEKSKAKLDMDLKFTKGIDILDNILNAQISLAINQG